MSHRDYPDAPINHPPEELAMLLRATWINAAAREEALQDLLTRANITDAQKDNLRAAYAIAFPTTE